MYNSLVEQINQRLEDLKDRFRKISDQFDREALRGEINQLTEQMNKPGSWEDQEHAKAISRQLSNKQKLLATLGELGKKIRDGLGLSLDKTMHQELNKEADQIDKQLWQLELKLFLSGPHDESEAILSIHAGAGGVEAMDWAAMLTRMYQRYFDKQEWKYEIYDESIGLEAGYKSITMIIHELYSYGLLKGEAGTHRLVRLSPFNADNLRQTSFALVEVLPVIESDTEIGVNPEEIEFASFRSSGAGGQNVNKVSTAVRLKHIPTGIVVTAQTERSQLQNRENALKLLKAKLWSLRQAQEKETLEEIKGPLKQASWGTQIRSYILHPYHLVKDLRTNIQTSDTDAVLNGDLDQFLEAELRLDKKTTH